MKTSLILVSGLLSDSSVWKHQLQHLGDIAAIQVVSPSQDSAKAMVDAILDRAPPTFALAGHSMGGWLCLEILRVAPSRVSKLCLLNTSARDDSKEKAAMRQAMIAKGIEGHFDEIVGAVAQMFTQNPRIEKEIKHMFLDVGCDAFIRQETAMLHRQPCEAVLPKIHCPTLVIHAAQDRNFSLEDHLKLTDKIPNAKLAIIEDSGHMSPMEQPQAVTSHLRYWLSYF